jgi:ABC-type transport system substrate-binding protein
VSERIVSDMMLTLILAVMLGLMFNVQPFPVRAQETYGPRQNEGLEIQFFSNSSEAFAALEAGDVDFIYGMLNYDQFEQAASNPMLLLMSHAGNFLNQFDLNNNYTIADFPGVRNPLNDVTFRRALAHMVDKNWIVNEVLRGFAVRIDVPIGAAQMRYANESVTDANYPYPFNLTRSAELLDVYFVDTDDDGVRNYPADWPGRETGPNLDPIKFCIRSDWEQKLTAGRALADNMRALGVPVNQIEADLSVLQYDVFDLNFQIYTGGWCPVGPPTYLYNAFHSERWGSANIVTGMNSSNLPNYPALDDVLEDVHYATSIEDFKAAVKKASGLIVAEYCVNIPLWSDKYWYAYNKYLAGVVDLGSTYTFLNAYKVDDPATPEDESQGPIRMGTTHVPEDLNILCTTWSYGWPVLEKVFAGLMKAVPYNLAEANPWIAQDWNVSTWYDAQDNQTKTVVTYWIRKDVWWHAPVTGEATRKFTAHDLEFTIWYGYSFFNEITAGWLWGSLYGVHHTNVLDDSTVEVYFDYQSMWAPYGIGEKIPVLPKDEHLNLLCGTSSANFYSDGTNCTASTRFLLSDEQIVQVISAEVNGEPLVEGVNFEIFATGSPNYAHKEIHLLTDLPEGTVTINYYTPTVDPHGYYLGDLDWTQTFYSLGPYYPTSVTSGVGGSAIFNCVSSFFLETPPLGEIDWIWTWTGTTRPRSGYYQINLFDAVKLLTSYGSSGYGTPDTNWFPGADLNPNDPGRITLYDAVTVISKYGTKWGTPPL